MRVQLQFGISQRWEDNIGVGLLDYTGDGVKGHDVILGILELVGEAEQRGVPKEIQGQAMASIGVVSARLDEIIPEGVTGGVYTIPGLRIPLGNGWRLEVEQQYGHNLRSW